MEEIFNILTKKDGKSVSIYHKNDDRMYSYHYELPNNSKYASTLVYEKIIFYLNGIEIEGNIIWNNSNYDTLVYVKFEYKGYTFSLYVPQSLLKTSPYFHTYDKNELRCKKLLEIWK